MVTIESVIAKHGGVATTAQLVAAGLHAEVVRMWARDRSIRIRRGLWAAQGAPAEAILALKFGGRLGCVSAVAYWGGGPQHPELHVCLPGNSRGFRGASGDAVVHWSRRDLDGDCFAVSLETAHRQMARCSAVER